MHSNTTENPKLRRRRLPRRRERRWQPSHKKRIGDTFLDAAQHDVDKSSPCARLSTSHKASTTSTSQKHFATPTLLMNFVNVSCVIVVS